MEVGFFDRIMIFHVGADFIYDSFRSRIGIVLALDGCLVASNEDESKLY